MVKGLSKLVWRGRISSLDMCLRKAVLYSTFFVAQFFLLLLFKKLNLLVKLTNKKCDYIYQYIFCSLMAFQHFSKQC